MPTLVRSVCKVALFILVIAVSGVGVAQADPGVAPPNPDVAGDTMTESPAAGVITPDVVRQSARLYATAEQVRSATISGGAQYMFSENMVVSDNRIMHFTVWDFYKINGREDHFFVDTVSTAQGRYISPDEEYRVKGIFTKLSSPATGAPPLARLKQWAPGSIVRLPDDKPTTFSLTYQGASISRMVPPTKYTYIDSSSQILPGGSRYSYNMSVYYTGRLDAPDFPEVRTGGSVSRWQGDAPWGMEVSVWGQAVSLQTREDYYWSAVKKVGE